MDGLNRFDENQSQCEKTQDTVKENWSEKMLPNYQILC